MNRLDILREIQSMLPEGWGKYHVARDIWKLAEQPEGTFRNVGPKSGRRSMSQSEAKRAVDAAVARIKLVDSGG
jgi:hypothetical protein